MTLLCVYVDQNTLKFRDFSDAIDDDDDDDYDDYCDDEDSIGE